MQADAMDTLAKCVRSLGYAEGTEEQRRELADSIADKLLEWGSNGGTLDKVRKEIVSLREWIDRERSGRYGKLKRLDVLNSIDKQLRQITTACPDGEDGAQLAAMPANGSFAPDREWSWSINDHDYEEILTSEALTTPLRPLQEEYQANRAKAAQLGPTFPIVLQKQWEVSLKYAMFATPIGYLIDERGILASDVAVGVGPILALAGEGVHESLDDESSPLVMEHVTAIGTH
jgi:hypothetical protein